MIPRGARGAFRRSTFRSALLALCLCSLGGCGDDDENPIDPGTPFEPSRSTPHNTLSALDYYYETRDSTGTKTVYDSTYTGTSTDLNDPGSPIYLTYQDEVSHVAALARTPGLRAWVDLGPSVTWARLSSDDPSHPEWALIQISGSNFSIRIDDTQSGNTYEVGGVPGAFQEFAFTPALDSASPTDTLWRIVRWREVGTSSPAGP